MRIFGLLLMIVSVPGLTAGTDQPKKVRSSTPLSADEIAIYRAVLEKYAENDSAPLNVSIRTFPFDASSPTSGFSSGNCSIVKLDNIGVVSHTFHDLTTEVLSGKNMRLVDPKKQSKVVGANDPSRTIGQGKSVDSAVRRAFSTGLFSMSEIGFDKDHGHAVVSYSFWCGSLCGHGSTLIFEKRSDGWHKTGAECGGYVS